MPDTPSEIDRIREHHHALAGKVSELQVAIAEAGDSREALESIRAELRSLTTGINSNTTAILQRMTSVEAWQEAHEKLDEERWQRLDKQLSKIEAMVEATPVEIGRDLGKLEVIVEKQQAKIEELDTALKEGKATIRTVAAMGGIATFLMGLFEFFFHRK